MLLFTAVPGIYYVTLFRCATIYHVTIYHFSMNIMLLYIDCVLLLIITGMSLPLLCYYVVRGRPGGEEKDARTLFGDIVLDYS